MNRDFHDVIGALFENDVDFLIVWAHALAAHGIVRVTGDLDIWVKCSPENTSRVWEALAAFGAPMDRVERADFGADDRVVQLGVPPGRIDLMTSIQGVTFSRAWENRVEITLDGMNVPVIGRDNLIRNKRSTGRHKDLLEPLA